jgi:membrane protein YqaA with SNARE-associated domain
VLVVYNGNATVTNRGSSKKKYIAISVLAATVVISVVGSLLLIWHWRWVEGLSSQGYLGLFIISLFAGSPIPIPTPSMILTFTLGSLLNPVLVGLVSGLGNGIGNALIFLTGRGGLLFFQNSDVSAPAGETSSSRIGRFLRKIGMPRMSDFAKRRAVLAVFLLSIYPNPVLTPMILGIGAMRFRFTKFFLACWAGKTAQSLILAYLGYFGLGSLLRFLGIFNVP